jgi:transcriptional regulator with XRE-family HTH domain
MSATVNDLISAHYAPLASRRKVLARDAGVSPRTAENWLAKLCEPQACKLKSLADNNPEFRADLIAWLQKGAS